MTKDLNAPTPRRATTAERLLYSYFKAYLYEIGWDAACRNPDLIKLSPEEAEVLKDAWNAISVEDRFITENLGFKDWWPCLPLAELDYLEMRLNTQIKVQQDLKLKEI